MSQPDFANLDDDRIATAAKRIIRQYQLQQYDHGDEGVVSSVTRSSGASDDVQGLKLALDDMGQAIKHMQRLLASREAVFMAALERVERNMAKIEGRVDALADEIAAATSRPLLDIDAVIDDQRTTTLSIMREFGGLMELGRCLMDEIRQMHTEIVVTTGEAPVNKLFGS
jgi:hypothetical protein